MNNTQEEEGGDINQEEYAYKHAELHTPDSFIALWKLSKCLVISPLSPLYLNVFKQQKNFPVIFSFMPAGLIGK